ncbi:MAG: hypothetical protein IPK00_06245 [Deltaproteobacteria bacterium]|nr:hypothetical protein [Deltaproteobacteria bacterium]
MSEFDAKPIVVFKTLTNTELGAEHVVVDANGDIVLRDVLKKVTESMLTSYPRTQLGLWTPNRAAIRYKASEIEARDVRRFDTGKKLSLAEIKALAS